MFHDLCIPLAMKLMAPGFSLYEAECLATIIVLQLVLLFALSGIRISGAECDDGICVMLPFPGCSRIARNRCGIFPAHAGTAADLSRSLLYTQ